LKSTGASNKELQVVFLGTNGWYDTNTGNTICILVKTNEYYIIFDAGNGIYKVDDYCDDKRLTYLFLSHFHLEHIIGLHILNKIKCFQKLHIFGPAGTKSILKKIIAAPFTMPIFQLPFGIEIYELPKDQKKLPFYVNSKSLLHSSLTLGFRIELNRKIISYCPDTGYCENAVELSRYADLLIAECAYKRGQKSHKWPHLNPETAARIAKEANAKKLALVHFDADIYKTIEDRKKAEMHAQRIFTNTFVATDDMRIIV
jgi:ribonuclease BN (tRNA processing enzyme)